MLTLAVDFPDRLGFAATTQADRLMRIKGAVMFQADRLGMHQIPNHSVGSLRVVLHIGTHGRVVMAGFRVCYNESAVLLRLDFGTPGGQAIDRDEYHVPLGNRLTTNDMSLESSILLGHFLCSPDWLGQIALVSINIDPINAWVKPWRENIRIILVTP